MSPEFSIADRSTWPEVLTLDQIAAIYRRKPSGLMRASTDGTFVPAPFLKRPLRWRKTSVLRHLDSSAPAVSSHRRIA